LCNSCEDYNLIGGHEEEKEENEIEKVSLRECLGKDEAGGLHIEK
jgi:hypothetical protein